MRNYRPWGLIAQFLPPLARKEWHFVGCLGAEERSIEARKAVDRSGVQVVSESWYKVNDGQNRFTEQTNRHMELRTAQFLSAGWGNGTVRAFDLLSPYDSFVDAFQAMLSASSGSLLIDISSFPKRFFFPLVRLALLADNVRDIVFLYSVPERYGSLPISEELESLEALPLFNSDFGAKSPDVLLLSLGLQTLGVLELIEASGGAAVQLLAPYSSKADVRSNILKFQKAVESNLSPSQRRPIRFVSPLDVSAAYSEMIRLVGNNSRAVLAPFGPKPVSLAMALAGASRNWSAFYSQPKVYNPEYSLGIARVHGELAVYGYLAITNGRRLYE